jgi:hypothetical protein
MRKLIYEVIWYLSNYNINKYTKLMISEHNIYK